jgi:hypothetical protein
VTAAILVGTCVVAHAQEPYRFVGPAPARNFQPIQFIFLHLPFERAATLGRGEIGVQLSSAEANEIATTQGRYESTLKFETNRTVLSGRYGLAPGWEVGLDLPFISRFGGFLDPVIDEIEYVFGVGNVERDLFPNNSFGAFDVKKNGVRVFHGDEETLELGDLWVSAKREFHLDPTWPVLALRAAVKAPTGDADKVTGSGKVDFGAGLAADHRAFARLMLYLNLSLVYPDGPITPLRLTLNPIFSQSFAAEYALTHRLTAMLHQAVYTSPMHGTETRLLDGTPVEIGFGLNYTWSEHLALQLLAIDNVSPVEPAADFTLLLSMATRFGRPVASAGTD